MSIPLGHCCDMSKLRNTREAQGLTREELARQSGTSTSTIARIELNGHLPSVLTMRSIARVLGVTVDDLIPNEDVAA